jgi:hypothetical protein
MSRDHPAGQNHNLNIDQKSFDMLEHFKGQETTLTKQNSIREQIHSRFNSRKSFVFKFAIQKHDGY